MPEPRPSLIRNVGEPKEPPRSETEALQAEKDRVVNEFFARNEAEITANINDQILYRQIAVEQELPYDKLTRIITERELLFCRHILSRLVEIMHDSSSGHQMVGRTVTMNTTLLSDIDETLGSAQSTRWHLRPSAKCLLRTIKEQLGIEVVLLSTREQADLDQQIVDSNYEGSLVELADSVSTVRGIYVAGSGLAPERNLELIDYSIYGTSKEMDEEQIFDFILAEAGTTAETITQQHAAVIICLFEAQKVRCRKKIERIMQAEGVRIAELQAFCADPAGWLTNHDLYDITSVLFFVEENINNILTPAEQQQFSSLRRLLSKYSLATEGIELSDLPDSSQNTFGYGHSKHTYSIDIDQQEATKRGVIEELLPSQLGNLVALVKKYIAYYQQMRDTQIHQVASEIEAINTEQNDSAEWQKKIKNICALAEDAQQGILPIATEDADTRNSIATLAMLYKNAVEMSSDNWRYNTKLAEKVSTAVAAIIEPKQEHEPVSCAMRIRVFFQRLAYAKKLLDNNDTEVTITLDDNWSSVLLEKFFSGEIRSAQGQDAYTYLGLEHYRQRLFVMTCGTRGEYDLDVIKAETKAAA